MKGIGPSYYLPGCAYSRRTFWRAALDVTILVLVAGFHPVRSVASELSDIADAYRRQARDVESLYVAYHITSEPLGARADIRSYLGTLVLENEHKVFAFKDHKRYSKMSCPNGGVYDDLLEKDPDGRPKKVSCTADAEYAFDGTHLYSINDTTGSNQAPASIVPINRSRGGDSSYFDQEYMRWAFRMLPDALNIDKDRADSWLAGVIDGCNCRVRSRSETVDGAACIVIAWQGKVTFYGEDRKMKTELRNHAVWCDPQMGYAVRKRETLLASTGGLLESRYAFSEFVEVAKGVWLPRKGYWDRYAPEQAPSQLHNVPLIRYTYNVTDIHANDVPDDLFALSFPPGAHVRDERYLKNGQPIFYTMPAGGEDLDMVIELALKGQGIGEILSGQRLGRRLTIGLLLLPMIFLIGIGAYRIIRKFRPAS